jgi:DNA polymerase I-like protein with 3'-5' exonuclease and polymerase domains
VPSLPEALAVYDRLIDRAETLGLEGKVKIRKSDYARPEGRGWSWGCDHIYQPDLREQVLLDLASLSPFPEVIGRILGPRLMFSGGLVDVDLDSHEAVRAAPHLLPTTGMVSGRAGKRQSHYWYKVPDPPPKASAKFKDPDRDFYRLADGDGQDKDEKVLLLELRSTGSQTVVPPSAHPTGEVYTWHDFRLPAEVALDTLREAMCQLAAAALLARHWPALGCRHDLALALAGGLLRNGWSVDRARRFLHGVYVAAQTGDIDAKLAAVADTAAKLGLGEEVTGWPSVIECLRGDGRKVVAQVCTWLGIGWRRAVPAAAKKRVRVLVPYASFPVDALPQPLAEYVRQGALALGCDAAYLGLPALAVAAGLIGYTRVVRLKRTWKAPSVLWTMVIADSGSLKTPAFRLTTDYLFTLQRRLDEEFEQALVAYAKARDEWQEKATAAKESGQELPAKPEPPVHRSVFTSDATIEAVAELIGDNPRGIIISCDELACWLGSFARYKAKGAGSDVPRWLSMHSAGGFAYHRRTGDKRRIVVPHAAVSVCGGIQPGILAKLIGDEFLAAGLAARLLMAMPPRPAKTWTELEVSPEVEEAYRGLLDRLLALDHARDRDGERVPHVLSLAPDAKPVWVAWYNAWGQEQAAAEGELAAALAKLEEAAARFALIHHVVTHVGLEVDDLRPVGLRSVEAGVTLARWCAAEARRVYTILTETTEDRDARRLVEFLQSRGGRATVKELQRSNAHKYPTAAEAEQALETLVACGRARWQDRPPTARGGRPTRDCVLNQTTDETDETDNDGPDDGPDDGLEASDETSGAGDETPQNPEDFGVSSVSSVVGQGGTPSRDGGQTARVPEWGFVGQSEVSSDGAVANVPARMVDSAETPPRLLISGAAGLGTVRAALDESTVIGLDLETTGLDPRTDRVRLLSLATDQRTFLVDAFVVDPRPLWEHLAEKTLVGHNLAFDLSFLAALGFSPGPVGDTMLLSRLLYGTRRPKGFHTLEACAERELGRSLDKTMQTADWSGPLSPAHLAYAAADVDVLVPLHEALVGKVHGASMEKVAEIEARCLPAVAWMAGAGAPFELPAWEALATEAEAAAKDLARQMDAAAPPREGFLFRDGAWNWLSPAQVKEAFALLGVQLDATDDDALAAADHPLAELLRRHRAAAKLVSTYGTGWVKGAYRQGRLYAGWVQIGADSGRMACKAPNLQNLPRDPRYRACFRAPEGRVLVKADYSQIELRIAAKVSGDKALLEVFQRNDDLHTRTARSVLGIEEVTKRHRQLAKALNFGLLYGMGAKGFRKYAKAEYGQDLTEDQAAAYRAAFFRAYPGLAAWHRRVGATGKRAVETRTRAGRRRLGVERYTEQLNSPVQGTGADGLKLALALLWERRDQCPGAFPVLVIHDEIVLECDADQADAAAARLKQAMLDGMAPLLDPVPVEVEVRITRTWGGE